jgi:type I restriction enzyme S subunit
VSALLEVSEPSARYLIKSQPRVLRHFELVATAPKGMLRLRELILTLAVHGKLVPQDPAEEHASGILDQIRLVQRAQKPRERRQERTHHAFRPVDLDRDMPNGWIAVRNSDLFSLRKGRVPGGLSDTPTGIPYLDIDALDRGLVKRYTNDQNCPTCTVDDILVVCDGSRSGLVLQGKNGAVGSTLAVIETPRPLQSYVKLIFREGFQRFNSGMKGAAIPHLDTKAILAEVVGLPPLAEQARIIDRVDELMRLCDALEAKGRLEAEQHARLLGTLLGTLTDSSTPEELAANWQRVSDHFDLLLDRPEAVDALEQTILRLAVRGLLVPQDPQDEPASELLKTSRSEKIRLIAEGKIKRDKPLPPIAEDEKPFLLPKGWAWVRLRDMVTHLGDGLHGTPNYSPEGVYYFVNGNNLRDGAIVIKPETKRVDKSEFEKYKKPLDETTVLLSINGTLGNVGFYRGEQVVLGKSACYFNLTSGLAKAFIRTLLECPDFQRYATASATGSTIKNLGLKAIGNWPIALPPLAEQSRIVTRVAQLRRLCADLRQRLDCSGATQTAIAVAVVDQALVA